MISKFKKLQIFIITILLGMVFSVNIGYAFATATDYDFKIEATSELNKTEQEKRSTYLNDVVINNSTVNIPIAYREGTVLREISFDYSFSEPTDYCITYELKYNDGTPVDNVLLNYVNRDNYLVDQETVLMDDYTTVHNTMANKGTIYAMEPLSGTGNIKLFNGVTFLTGNNKPKSYIVTADGGVQIGNVVYNAGSTISAVEYQYAQLEMARYWEVHERNESSKEIVSYICRTGHTMGSLSVAKGTIITADIYNMYISNGPGVYTGVSEINEITLETEFSLYWTKKYKCIQDVMEADGETIKYPVGYIMQVTDYNNLDNNKDNFKVCYQNGSNSYSIVANESIITGQSNSNIPKNTSVTAEQYALLSNAEQAGFAVNELTDYENKNLTMDLKIYNQTAYAGEDTTARQEYYDNHSFSKYAVARSISYDKWKEYKGNNGISPVNQVIIYNGHANYDNAIPYATDFGASEDMTTSSVSSKSNLKTSYIYKQNASDGNEYYFHSYAGGNRYNTGVGVFYLIKETTQINVQVAVNWYNANGDKISSMPVNNIRIEYNSKDANNTKFTKVVGVGYGYFDIIKYVQTVTEGDLFDMHGYSFVISSVAVTFTTPAGQILNEDKSISIYNPTLHDPILYTLSRQQMGSYYNMDIAVTNNTTDTKILPTVTLTPKFTIYNGYTGISTGTNGYGEVTPEKTVDFVNDAYTAGSTTASFDYDDSIWTCTKSDDAYTFTAKNGAYLAPGTSLNVITGVYIPERNWTFTIGSESNLKGDFWFWMDSSYTPGNDNSISYNENSSYKSMEVMTTLTDTAETVTSGTKTFAIAIRNNTSQKIDSLTLTGTLQAGDSVSNALKYEFVAEASGFATITVSPNGHSFTISSSNLTLYPGESIYLGYITISEGENVKLVQYSLSVTLGAEDDRTGVIYKQDFASGNLTLINKGKDQNGYVLQTPLKNSYSLSDIIGYGTKWDLTGKYIQQGSSTSASAIFRENQICLLLNGLQHNVSWVTTQS